MLTLVAQTSRGTKVESTRISIMCTKTFIYESIWTRALQGRGRTCQKALSSRLKIVILRIDFQKNFLSNDIFWIDIFHSDFNRFKNRFTNMNRTSLAQSEQRYILYICRKTDDFLIFTCNAYGERSNFQVFRFRNTALSCDNVRMREWVTLVARRRGSVAYALPIPIINRKKRK